MPALVVRHGPTAFNSEQGERIRGWLDIPLTPEGGVIARQTAQWIAEQDLPISHIYSTDLQRGTATAEALAQAIRKPLSVHSDLRPWNLGALHGQSVSLATPQIDALVKDPLRPAPVGGESFYQFLCRFLPFVMPLVRAQPLVAVVTHIRNVKALEAHLAAQGYGIHTPTWEQPPTVDPGGVALAVPYDLQPVYTPAAVAV